jgi:DNA-binding MurR/RpiR family transcriptional regulator
MESFETLIRKKRAQLTKAHLRILTYILDNIEEAIFLNASKLGKKVSVSESSVIRLSQSLGFEGYPAMQRKLQEHFNYRVSTISRLNQTLTDFKDTESVFVKSIQDDIDNLNETLRSISKEAFEQAVSDMWSAQRIFIVGFKQAHAPALVLASSIGYFKEGVYLIEPKVGHIWDSIYGIGNKDLVIGISFPRYARLTVEVLEYAKKHNANVGVITDSLISPLAAYANWLIEAKCKSESLFESYTSSMSIVNALITALSLKDPKGTMQKMEAREKLWREKRIYYSRKKDAI